MGGHYNYDNNSDLVSDDINNQMNYRDNVLANVRGKWNKSCLAKAG